MPLTFSPIINDEANILAAITRGDRTIFDLAEEHGTTVANFAVWLQREDIQQKLNDLTSAGTTLTRVAAVNQLPKAVKAMAFQIEAHIFDRTHNLIKPGLAADKISALRDANARKACNLLLRLARFDPSLPLYRKRERDESSTLAPRSNAERGEVASAQHEPVRGALSKLPQGGAVEPGFAGEIEGAPAFSTASSSASPPIFLPATQPDILDLCAAALSASKHIHESRISEPETRNPDPERSARSFTSHIPLPTSDIPRGRLIRHTKPPESPPKSRPPPTR